MEPIQVALLEHLEQLVCCDFRYQNILDIPVCIAFSGGLDSSVLLHAANELKAQRKIIKLSAAHVNHGLQPENREWQTFCESTCHNYQVTLTVKKLELAAQNDFSENAARVARYNFFEELMKFSGVMLFAHHQDDQAETLLFRMLRGSGIHGLAGMPSKRDLGNGCLLRPLLKFSRQQLNDYASRHKLHWVEDPSNQTDRYSRNYLRNKIIPLLEVKWPKVQSSLQHLSHVAADQVEILDEIAFEDLRDIADKLAVISVLKLSTLSLARRKNVLHYWIRKHSGASPSSTEIAQVIKQLKGNISGSLEVKAAKGWVRGYDNKLHYCVNDEPIKLANSMAWENTESAVETDNGLLIYFSELLESDDLRFQIRKPNKQEVVTVRARVGGEIAKPINRGHSTELKKIYQELKVPSWQRVWLPIIYYNDQIAAVPGVFVEQSFSVDKGGFALRLERK